MHADLIRLIDLQSKDAAVAAAERRLTELGNETIRVWIRRSSGRRISSRRPGEPPPRRSAGGTSWRPRSRATAFFRIVGVSGSNRCGTPRMRRH